VLILGLAYKKDISDIRESPSLRLLEILVRRGAKVEYHDPFVPVILSTRAYREFMGKHSVELTASVVAAYDAILIATDHTGIDCAMVAATLKYWSTPETSSALSASLEKTW
jgi:UDP-N-acetyl-D-glucosamine dehydrogenase